MTSPSDDTAPAEPSGSGEPTPPTRISRRAHAAGTTPDGDPVPATTTGDDALPGATTATGATTAAGATTAMAATDGADAATPAAAGTTPDDVDGAAAATTRASSRRRPLVIGLAALVLVLVVVLGVLLATRGGQREPFSIVTETITMDAAVPGDPIELDTSTELAAALPGTVLGYAVTAQDASSTMTDLHAVESWALTYGSAAGDVQLQVGQWPNGTEAKEALAAVRDVDGAEPVGDPEDVVVDGESAGDVQTQLLPDGSEITSWRNGSAVLVAQGPEGTTRAFYDAFPF